ncbi:MAG: redox-regulated ATPase YchF [Candidatus Krumholzibacteriota bacterium]|nr:redox-regulated ATPase YchF [Candidatus Krumholzibacteriota bacterium]
MRVVLAGCPQSGKSTLFSAISGLPPAAPGDPSAHGAIVPVPDERVTWLTSLYEPRKVTLATIDCLDIPGLDFSDETGRALARRLLDNVRTADMFVLVIGAFGEGAGAARELRDLRAEFLLADLETVAVRIERLGEKQGKPHWRRERDGAELELQLRLQEVLEQERPAAEAIRTEEEASIVRQLHLLTMKPVAVVLNVDEGTGDPGDDEAIEAEAGEAPVVCLSALLEREIAELPEEERADFMAALGIETPAAARFVRVCYEALGLVSFLTVGSDEVRAWPIPRGTTAVEAAGRIHSDIRRGFIRAETISYAALRELGSEKAVRAAGRARLEGKQYIVQDGDIISFRFNV